jgi:glycosyltransferase involved in cell wall biosynthesis
MRVAIVSHTYVVGSNRGKVYELNGHDGIDVLLVVPKRWKNRDINHVIQADPLQEARHRSAIVRAWPVSFGSLVTYAPVVLYRILREFRPNVIYVEEEPWSLAALELSVLSAILRTRLVFFTWDNLGTGLPLLQRFIRALVLKRADGAVTGNQEAKRLLLQNQFRKPIAVIPQLGVDPGLFSAIPERTDHDFVIGYIGRLVLQKGIMLLIEAAARVPGVRLLIVGRGPVEQELVERTGSLGLDGRFELCTGVAHHRVPEYLRRMDALVLPSLTTRSWKEQFGHVLIEAMACGIPVIGTDSGAIPEVIENAGIVVKEGNVDELASALQRLKDDPTLRNALRTRGLAKVELEYTNRVVAIKLAHFLMAV